MAFMVRDFLKMVLTKEFAFTFYYGRKKEKNIRINSFFDNVIQFEIYMFYKNVGLA